MRRKIAQPIEESAPIIAEDQNHRNTVDDSRNALNKWPPRLPRSLGDLSAKGGKENPQNIPDIPPVFYPSLR